MLEIEKVTAEEISAVTAIVHEIRNPLQLIRANIQYLELMDASTKNKKNYDVIYREIDRINDILRCASLGENPFSLTLSGFAISELIEEIRTFFDHALKSSGTLLGVHIVENAEISADYDKLKQVLINIIKNAQESIEMSENNGRGKIDITVFVENKILYIKIIDNGAGISNEELTQIGTPFFTKKAKGSGLGVSISKEILERQNGRLNITGEKNKGACVTISFPVV